MTDAYAKYAPFYDATQGSSGHVPYLKLLRDHHPGADTLLELACGTGANLLELSRFYSVTGLDSSPAMLRLARKKLPGIEFHEQDMSSFQVGRKFDSVIIPYDSINHLRRFSDWIRTFRRAKRHLNAGGLLIFDVNTPRRLRELVQAGPSCREFDGSHLIIDVTDAGRGVTNWHIKVFERIGVDRFRLHVQVIQETGFDHRKIMAALRRLFSEVKAYDGGGRRRPGERSGRIFYVCRVAA